VFGIKVTIIEPGSFETTFGSSVRPAPPMPEYDALRQARRASFKPEDVGDPAATAGAILQIVDIDNPLLRLVPGATTIAKFQAAYEQRLKNWNDWSEVSITAHG
jgi:hypothetical protein